MGWSTNRNNFFSSIEGIFGGIYQKVLNLVLINNVNNPPIEEEKISEDAILRFFLSEETLKVITELEDAIELSVDEKQKRAEMLKILKKNITKEDKLTKVEFYKNKMGSFIPDLGKFHHKFVVFKTTGTKGEHYWWSVEKNKERIVIQRCSGEGKTEKNAVKKKLEGKDRGKVKKCDDKQYDGKGTIYDLLQYAVVYGIIEEKYHLFYSNCQQLVEFLSPKITAGAQKISGILPYTPPPMQCKKVGKNDYLLNVFNFPDWSPITAIIYMDNIQLLQKAFADGKYDINAFSNGITPLNLAIFFSRIEMVEYLLNEMKADPTKCDNDGKTPIQMAAMFSTEGQEIIQLLLKKQVDVNHQDQECGNTALHYAVLSSKSESTVEFLLEKEANPALANRVGNTALHLAALEENNTKIIDRLLNSNKVEINQRGQDGMTPLHSAVSQSNLQCVRHLLDKGANPTLRDNNGFSPLDMAAQYGKDVKLIDLLLKTEKVNVNDKDIETKQTPLHCAASNSNALTAGYLIEKGADLKAVDKNGYTPFNLAASKAKNEEIIDRFLDIGKVNINDKDEKSGQTALHYATRNSNALTARHLIKIGADLKAVDKNGYTPFNLAAWNAKNEEIIDVFLDIGKVNIEESGQTALHCAVMNSNVISTRRLIEKGADPTLINDNKQSALHVAVAYAKNTEIIDCLFDKNNINQANSDGMTPLHYAVEKSNLQSVRRLLEKGANRTLQDNNGRLPLDIAERLPSVNEEIINRLKNE